MICKGCRVEIDKEEPFDSENNLCLRCFEEKVANEYAQEILPFLLKHNVEFQKIDFGNGEGFNLKLENGININFFYAGRVDFEYEGDKKWKH